MQSPDSDLPVGFTSFCQDHPDQRQTHAADVSFAEAMQDSDEFEHTVPQSVRKREAKLSAKKSELYLQILRDHGYTEDDIERKLSQSKVSYVIPPLGELSSEKHAEKQAKPLTVTKPFDLQTSKRIRLQDENEA